MQNPNEEICCPRFDPDQWHGKILDWGQKPFVRTRVWCFFFMPLTLGSAMRRLDEQIRQAGGTFVDAMALSEHTSPFTMWQYLAVDRPLPGMDNVPFNGRYRVWVFEGPFEKTGDWMRQAETDSKAERQQITRWFMWYTTCPKCAKKYGKNYVAVFGQLA